MTVHLTSFERFVSETAAALIEVPLEELDPALERTLGSLVRELEMDRGTVVEIDPGGRSATVVCSWARDPLPAVPRGALPVELLWGLEEAKGGRPVVFDRLEDLPPDASELRDWFGQQGVRSHLAVPMIVGGEVVGVLAFARTSAGSDWPTTLFDRLLLLARIFAALLERRRREADLRLALDEVTRLRRQLEAERNYLRQEIDHAVGLDDVVRASAAFDRVLKRALRVAGTDSTVLILGETGTGKEVVARCLHAHSRRSERPLIKVNCAAMPSELIESELFGHEKGAFTGATQRRRGRFKLADGGTLFLDEIAELDAASQAKLLRVLQDGEFQPLGSERTESVDVRVIAATNRDLAVRVEEGEFREDLFYRLNVFPLELPPLRDRPEDVEPLIWHFISRKRSVVGSAVTSIPDRVLEQLRGYSWPGNVRELENVIERAMILSSGPDLELAEPLIPAAIMHRQSSSDALDDVERSHIVDVLERCAWKINGAGNAAEHLGLHPNTLRNRMKKLGIARPS